MRFTGSRYWINNIIYPVQKFSSIVLNSSFVWQSIPLPSFINKVSASVYPSLWLRKSEDTCRIFVPFATSPEGNIVWTVTPGCSHDPTDALEPKFYAFATCTCMGSKLSLTCLWRLNTSLYQTRRVVLSTKNIYIYLLEFAVLK